MVRIIESLMKSLMMIYGWYVLHLLHFFFEDRISRTSYKNQKGRRMVLYTWRQFERGFLWAMGGSFIIFQCDADARREDFWKIVRMSLLYVLTDDDIECNRRYIPEIFRDITRRIRWRITPTVAAKYQRIMSIEMLALDDRWCNSASLHEVFRKDCLKGVYSSDTFFLDIRAPDLARKCGALLQLCDDIADIDEDKEMGLLTFAGFCGARTSACIVLQYIRDAEFPKMVHSMLVFRLWCALFK